MTKWTGSLKNPKVLIILGLVAAYSAVSAYSVMSDTSVRGLTVRIFDLSRRCIVSGTSATVTFDLTASIWSTHSLRTTITKALFSLTVDGVPVGTHNGNDASFDPGTGTSYTLTFQNQALDPRTLPASSKVLLALTSMVSAGISSETITATDSIVQSFTATAC